MWAAGEGCMPYIPTDGIMWAEGTGVCHTPLQAVSSQSSLTMMNVLERSFQLDGISALIDFEVTDYKKDAHTDYICED